MLARYVEDKPLDSINTTQVPWQEVSRSQRCEALLDGIRRNDRDSIAEFLKIFGGGVRFFLNRKLPQLTLEELQEQTHEVFRTVLVQISDGDLVDAMQVARFLRLAVRKIADEEYDTKRRFEKSLGQLATPLSLTRAAGEFSSEQRKRVDIAQRIFRQLPKRKRIILYRYYNLRQTAEQIAAEFAISLDEFRQIRNEVKTRLLGAWEAPNNPVQEERDCSAA